MECREMVVLIHECLDGETDELANQSLLNHMKTCSSCRQHMHELQRVIAFVQSASHIHVSPDFTARVLAKLPAPTKKNLFSSWLRNHPFLTAAAVFFVLMAGSLSANWFDRNDILQVSSANMDKLKIDRERNVVVVPEGTSIDGDLVVRNGDVEVQGEVRGNVVAIEGKVFVASTAQVVGNTESIEAIVDWIWYEVKNIGNDLLPIMR
ncbi:transmembrane transcriptional regulator (anti-sigma factor) [Brevibacillus panacihumi W25]|uniref:Anti-sigma-W factor RsiW n=1 Tax=Brevibacillus panacihumi W25 TaxID=1408254 RepID=V6M8D0_9BACL|nr:zf-HC2 domain-containing protein [Brevibacillus panacihumi]EST51588.1 transmembrane transcriptional regulator (anti-sigma factor) [Brevibacillus panacihumi W25]HZG80610.1 zf-HC2 domain-containing protein [Brevibacillus sp.]